MTPLTPLPFTLGRLHATPGALQILEAKGRQAAEFIRRHQALDQGALTDEDHALNVQATHNGSRILSSYRVGDVESAPKLWIITEAAGDDGRRALTTLLLPSEY